jgi:HEAT repeat protein
MTDSSEPNIDQLIGELASNNSGERQGARNALVEVGSPAVPGLLAALDDKRQHVRWEAAKTLAAIADPAAAEALVQALGDDDGDVRWVAGEALVALQQHALKPVLNALTESQHSGGLYKSAHHVLHDLSQQADLQPLLAPVLKALDRPEPEVAVPVEAERALESLR